MQTEGTNVSDYVIEELCKDDMKGLLGESVYFFHNKPLR